jgi:hypothetical protein
MKRLPAVAITLILLLVVAWVIFRDRKEDAASPPQVAAPTAPPSANSPSATGKPVVAAPNVPAKAPEPKNLAKGQLVLHGKWGSEPGQFGRRHDAESNPEAPMAITVGAGGQVTIVDQINHRVQRFGKDGKPLSQLQTGGDTVQDLAPGAGGSTVLLDRLADRNVQVYGPDGKLSNEVSLVGKNVPEGGGVTGLFADDSGIYVEREHGVVVRVADAQGNSDPDRPELPGRPTRDGRYWISAQLIDRANGVVAVRAVDRNSNQPAWQSEVRFPAPILHLLLLDSDRNGMVYVAADMGTESAGPPFMILEERVGVARLGGGGSPRGMIEIPAFPTADESFRPLTVDDDGSIYAMVPGPDGVDVVRYSF